MKKLLIPIALVVLSCSAEDSCEPTAVELCYDFVIDDYDDWFLPTTTTLTKIFELYKDGVIKSIN